MIGATAFAAEGMVIIKARSGEVHRRATAGVWKILRQTSELESVFYTLYSFFFQQN